MRWFTLLITFAGVSYAGRTRKTTGWTRDRLLESWSQKSSLAELSHLSNVARSTIVANPIRALAALLSLVSPSRLVPGLSGGRSAASISADTGRHQVSKAMHSPATHAERKTGALLGGGRGSVDDKPFDAQLVDPAYRPKRIILVRHGESRGNIDRLAYSVVPDNKIELTDEGFLQAALAGMKIRKLIGNESVQFFISPYMRARQTMAAMLPAFQDQSIRLSPEPRLREQDFGNLQRPDRMDKIFRDRQQFGRFFYRFPNGESGTDVYDRMASFITYMFRTMEHPMTQTIDNYVLVTHGLLMRFFCMCYLRWTVEEFEQVWNPENAEVWVLEKHPEHGTFELAGRWVANSQTGKFLDVRFGKNQNEPLFDHMKRPLVAREAALGGPNALDADELGFLSNLPGPRGDTIDAASSDEELMKYWDGPLPLDGEAFR